MKEAPQLIVVLISIKSTRTAVHVTRATGHVEVISVVGQLPRTALRLAVCPHEDQDQLLQAAEFAPPKTKSAADEMDKLRRSSRSGGRTSEDQADEVWRAFHTIDVAGTVAPPVGRASRSLSHGAAKAESWMARVSTAMSHRIFSGHSRSTQIMPMVSVSGQAVDGCAGGVAALVASSSENSFLVTKPSQSTEVVTLRDCEDAEVDGENASMDESDANCPSIACDVQDSSDESENERRPVRTVRAQPKPERVAKVAPTRGVAAFDDFDEDDLQPARRDRAATIPHYMDSAKEASTPGVLQDFFRRPPTAAVELREQQRRARREAHYRRIRDRQERLRARVNSEDAADPAADADRRRIRAQQLRKLSVARRLEFKREAAAAKELVVARVAAQDARALDEAKLAWERDFTDEMRELSDAFRAKTLRLHADTSRPTTVAGLAVPEAVAEIFRRDVSPKRRVQTAGDVSPRRQLSHEPIEDSSDAMEVLEGARCEDEDVDILEADNEEQEDTDADAGLVMDLDALGAEMDGVVVDLDALLEEREKLLRRVADIERIVACGGL